MRARPAANAGFTYIWLLLAIAFMAVGLVAVAEVATTAIRRDKEAELLFVGDQYARAISLYRASSPGAQQYPQKLEDLLVDKRFPNIRRHLRRVYPDPITGNADWGLVRGPGGGIVGVYSRSTTHPLKVSNFPKGYEAFANATSYAEWRFVAGVDGKIGSALSGTNPLGGSGQLAPPAANSPGTGTLAPPVMNLPGGAAPLAPPGANFPGGPAPPAQPGANFPGGPATLAPPAATLESPTPRPTPPGLPPR
jgi:type II secretory pathway pseudopilin PulG